ncbi:217_t:CDS:1, partial [Cetraspora pellucida]
MSNTKQPEKNDNLLDVTNEIIQLNLEDKPQDLNEIIKEMYDLYNQEILKGKSFRLVYDALE